MSTRTSIALAFTLATLSNTTPTVAASVDPGPLALKSPVQVVEVDRFVPVRDQDRNGVLSAGDEIGTHTVAATDMKTDVSLAGLLSAAYGAQVAVIAWNGRRHLVFAPTQTSAGGMVAKYARRAPIVIPRAGERACFCDAAAVPAGTAAAAAWSDYTDAIDTFQKQDQTLTQVFTLMQQPKRWKVWWHVSKYSRAFQQTQLALVALREATGEQLTCL